MNAAMLAGIMEIIPSEAEEIVVKGRDHDEVFFSMPKGWKPPTDLEERIKRAAPQQFYASTKTHWRWRAK